MNIILKFCVAAFCTIKTISCDDPLVKISQGWLRGKVQDAVTGDFQFHSFENIPYAKPPVGSLRFKAPEAPDLMSWTGVRDATAMGPMCPQYNPLTKIYNTGSEDCLTCNVYSRDLAGKSPVIVYISGFAYFFDGDYVDLYGPDFLLKEDVVVVIFNYRKDVFGFFNLGTEAVPGNAAMKDQVALLTWVKLNIAFFGGDPDSVTLAGTSSGSASIAHHLMSPMSTGLFHRAVMMSGVPSCDAIYPYRVQEQSYHLGKLLGSKTEDGDELLSFLQEVPFERLINSSYALAIEDTRNQLFKKMSTFVPVVEQDFGQARFITEDPMTTLDGGFVNEVKVMIGYSDKEALIVVKEYEDYLINLYDKHRELFVPNKILYETNQTDALRIAGEIKDYCFGDKAVSVENIKEFVQCNSLSGMIYDIIKFAQKISGLIETYLFKFSSTSKRNIYGQEGLKYGIVGASHGDMVSYLFHLRPLNMTVDVASPEYALIEQFVRSVTNFAKYGDPTRDADFTLHKFTTDELEYLEFTDKMTVKQDPNREDTHFWDSIYEKHRLSGSVGTWTSVV